MRTQLGKAATAHRQSSMTRVPLGDIAHHDVSTVPDSGRDLEGVEPAIIGWLRAGLG